jgi:hypothetical protein
MKRFAKIDGDRVVAVVEADALPGADFIEVTGDGPCGPGYLHQDGKFKPAGASFGFGVGIGYGGGHSR